MTIKYEYQCSACLHNYVEQRLENQPPFFVKCNLCKIGLYAEISTLNGYTFVDENNKVVDTVYANTQNEAEELREGICIGYKPNVLINLGDTYDSEWNVFIPAGKVYEPISKQILTPEEKAAL